MFVVSLLSRHMDRPTELHLQAAKRVLRYLKGTSDLGIFYRKGRDEKLVAYTDSDYAGDSDDIRSTSATSCACQAVWVRRILKGFNHAQSGGTTVFYDNSSAVELSKNPVLHG